MDRAAIESIVKKSFQKISNEGLGFLNNSITECTDNIMAALEKEAQKKLTLRVVNEAIQKEFPTCFLHKGEGYFFIASDDEKWGMKIASMYQQGIYVHKINQQSLERWMQDVRELFAEKNLPSYAQ